VAMASSTVQGPPATALGGPKLSPCYSTDTTSLPTNLEALDVALCGAWHRVIAEALEKSH
jgi:hypothetical protein